MSDSNVSLQTVPRVKYPLDTTGTSPLNLVKNELHTVSVHTDRDIRFIVPNFAPFYTRNLKVYIKTVGSTKFKPLKENVDYKLALQYRGATDATGQIVFGAIAFDNLALDGVIMIEYQCIGGDQIYDTKRILKDMIEKVWNPRMSDWEFVSNAPCFFPPAIHGHNLEDMVGMDELVAVLDILANNTAKGFSAMAERIDIFLSKFDFCKFEKLVFMLGENSFEDLINRIELVEQKQNELLVTLMFEKYLKIIEALDKYSFADLVERMDRLEEEWRILKESLDIDAVKEKLDSFEKEHIVRIDAEIEKIWAEIAAIKKVDARQDSDIAKLKKTDTNQQNQINKIKEDLDKVKGVNSAEVGYLRAVVDALSDNFSTYMDGYDGQIITAVELAETRATVANLVEAREHFMTSYPINAQLKDIIKGIK